MIPQELLYSKTHEWVRVEGNEATIGITAFAQEQLGDLTYIELPEVGENFAADDEIGSIESVKAASELFAPVAGEIIAINEDLEDAPEKVNQAPYTEGWLVRIKLAGEPKDLLNAAAYEEFVASEAE